MRTLVGLAVATVALAAQEVVQIDFRNHIPGVLDAPVFYPDGVTRVAYPGPSYPPHAALYVSKASGDPPFSSFWRYDMRLFHGWTNAGYWEPTLVTLPDVRLGDHVWVLVRAWEYGGWIGDIDLIGRQGFSKVLSLVVTNPVMTLAGLESFSLQPEHVDGKVREGQFVISWLHQGASTYWLDRTENLAATNAWVTVFTSTTEPVQSAISVTNALVAQPQFYRLRRSPLP